MNPFTVFFLILSLVEETLASASTPGIEDCEPRNCGGVSISYPFWLGGQQPSYCGPPSFSLTCSDDNHTQTPVLKVLDQSYYIKNISYDDQSVQLTAAVFVNDPCPLPRFNLTADIYPFSPSPANKKIFFLYNCSSSMDPSVYQNISCARHRTPVYFGGEYDGPGQLNSANSSCQLVVVPVLEHSEAGMKGNYAELLRTGWLLNWTATNCSECRESGGRCGYDESEARFACFCRDRIHLSSCKTRSSKKKFVIAGLAASTGFLALACVLGFLFYRHKKRQQHFTSSKFLTGEVDTEIGAHFQTHLFSYDELMEATNCFNASRELGDGGFGIVYKGKLRDGRTVAVKRLYEKNYKRVEQFMNEVKILSHLRHQNLVSLYGCTSHSSHELLLVYEFVPNGTVADHLHGNRASERILTWPMRLNIAIEIADAIVYLHAVDPPVIHRDVKTNNILLDSNFHVKVADFGLSRPFPADATHVSTTPQGTPGYVDPEYHQCYQLTEKSDVYSFGVVLVELISSKPAFDISRQRSEIKLANMAIAKIQNHELDDLVDQELWCQSDEVTKTMITMVAELAFRCLQLDRDMRPSIREVHEGLRVIESTASRVDEQGKDDIWTQDGAGLVKNIVKFSPDSVAGKWVSHSTTPNNSE